MMMSTVLMPTFDSDGYPTDETERCLALWPNDDINAALDFLAAAWNTTYGSVRDDLTAGEAEVLRAAPGERYLRLATGGWSGNESLIAAWRRNHHAYHRTYQLHARGGLWMFRYIADKP